MPTALKPGMIAAEADLIAFLLCVGFTSRIVKVKNVVDDRARGGLHVDGGEPLVFGEAERKRDVAVDIGSVGGDLIGHRDFDDHIRFAELPAGAELRLGGQLGLITFGHAVLHPGIEKRDFAVFQAALVFKIERSLLRLPWRHVL